MSAIGQKRSSSSTAYISAKRTLARSQNRARTCQTEFRRLYANLIPTDSMTEIRFRETKHLSN